MVIHIVKRGDTIWELSRKYGVSMQRIMNDNAISNPRNLVIGQALVILLPSITYTVVRGDTIYSIAKKFEITQLELIQNNPELIENTTIFPGQVLIIQFRSAKRREIVTNGYAYPHVRQNILASALPYLTHLTVFGYGFTDAGELIPINDQPLIDLAYKYKVAPVMLLSSITPDGNFDSEHASRMFNDTELQDKLLDNIIATMHKKGYLGLDSDFEFISPDDADAYVAFLKNAATQLHEHGFFLNTSLVPKTHADQPGLIYEGHDYPAIGKVSDTVFLMTYEWGYAFSPPMAVAPLNHVRTVVKYAVREIPPQKIMLGIPNYGYDWLLPFEKGTRATNISNEYAITLAARYGAEIMFDETAQSPHFNYWNSGQQHKVWFEDVRSVLKKLELADEFSLRGVGYWSLMYPFTQNWALLNALYHIRKVA